MNLKKLNYQTKVLAVLILINPFFDLVIGILEITSGNNFSYGGYFRFLMVFVIALSYLFHLIGNSSKIERKNFYIVLSSVMSYLIICIFINYKEYDIPITVQQLVYTLRYLSFIVFLYGLRPIIKKVDKNAIYDLLLITSYIYSALIVIPFITGTGLNSYSMDGLQGSVGWFAGANEIGFIIGFTSLISVHSVLCKGTFKENQLLKVISIVLPTTAMVLIGTKAALLFIIVYFTYIFIIVYRKITIERKGMFLIFTLIISFLAVSVTPAIKNILLIFEGKSISRFFHIILSGRITFFERTYSNFLDANLIRKLFGIGFMTVNQNGKVVVDKLVEMDLFDLFFRLGFVGFSVYITAIVLKISETIFISKERNLEFYLLITNIVMALMLGILIGHVFSAPSVSFFFAIIIIIYLDKL